jgi:hypothetical protein
LINLFLEGIVSVLYNTKMWMANPSINKLFI